MYISPLNTGPREFPLLIQYSMTWTATSSENTQPPESTTREYYFCFCSELKFVDFFFFFFFFFPLFGES